MSVEREDHEARGRRSCLLRERIMRLEGGDHGC
jgi:hypothetical protein